MADGEGWIRGTDITCIIPSHRRPRLLAETIASVLEQTEPIGRVLVVSDVNDPESEAVAAGIAATSAVPVQWIESPAGQYSGVSHSRNEGIRRATTNWVALLDDDDLWDPRFVEVVTNEMEMSRGDIGFVAKRTFGRGTGRHIHVPPGVDASGLFTVDEFAHGGNVIARVDLLRRYPYDTDFLGCEDWDLFIRLRNDGHEYVAIDDPLVLHRLHDGPRTSQMKLTSAKMLRTLANKHADVLTLRARRSLRYRAAYIERHHRPMRSGRAASWCEMIATVPIVTLIRRRRPDLTTGS